MRSTQPLTITLPLEMAQMVKDKVSSGQYATESEVIRDGLRTLAARDAAVDRWLREEVAPTMDALQKDPSLVSPLEDVRKRAALTHWRASVHAKHDTQGRLQQGRRARLAGFADLPGSTGRRTDCVSLCRSRHQLLFRLWHVSRARDAS